MLTNGPVGLEALNSPESREIQASVCICTRNRPHELRRALESIQRSRTRVSQVVVSDDSDDEQTRRMIAVAFPHIDYTTGPRRGLGANRNRAVRHATGTHVVFLDDDAELDDGFLDSVEKRLAGLPRSMCQRTIVTGLESKLGVKILPNEQDLLGFQRRRYRSGEPLRTVVMNATLFPRGLFDAVQFDPQLNYGYDEVDLTTRAVAHGFEIVACFDAINRHIPSPKNRDEYRPFTDASRLYVTLKRRRQTEGSWLRGWGGFWLAVIHAHLAAIKRRGLPGIREARRTVAHARAYYANNAESTGRREHPSR